MDQSSLFADFSSFSSPLEQVFSNVPKGHDKALRQSIYNVLVTTLFGILALSVYYVLLVVLEPFLAPLFWALMTGFVLHPYKTHLASSLATWLARLNRSERPVALTTCIDGFLLVDKAFEYVGTRVFEDWKLLLAIVIGVPLLHVFPFATVLNSSTVSMIFMPAYKLLYFWQYVQFIHVATICSAYCLAVLFMWTPERAQTFSFAAILLWTCLGCFCLNFLWPPILYGLALLALYTYVTLQTTDENVDETDSSSMEKSTARHRFREAIFTVLQRKIQMESSVLDAPPSAVSTPTVAKNPLAGGGSEVAKIEHPIVSTLKKQQQVRTDQTPVTSSQMTPLTSSKTFKRQYGTVLKRSNSVELDGEKESTIYISWILWCCLVLQLYIHPTLLHLLPFPIAYTLIKWLVIKFNLAEPFKHWTGPLQANVCQWLEQRSDAILPKPVKVFWREVYKLEKTIMKALPRYTDTIVTIVLILAIIVGFAFAVVFVSVQMYTESLYIVQTSGKLVTTITNSSLYQQMNDSLGDHQAYFKGIEDVIESGYHYGREYISSSVVSMLRSESSDNQESVDEFEKKLLELWDRIYQYWLNKNEGNNNNDSVSGEQVVKYGPQVSEEAISSSVEEVIQRFITSDALDLSAFSQFTMNNMGTLISVLEQGWTLLKGNLGFAFTVVTEMVGILFQSGSGMVNFVLSTVVYFTALFYLLNSSNTMYKPVELISNYSHMFVGSGFASALNKAINSVFTVTVKMASFYGLWTYLTHAIFSASIITVPVLVATFLAAVPVAGQYLVALPAALELWLAQDRWLSAAALIVCHIVPTYVVDAAIYAEVRQGIHPWITGLSIVGGVYYFGIVGAIYGPLILCGVYVILTVYTGWLQEIPMETTTAGAMGKSKMQQSLVTPVIKRSESVY